MNAAPATPSPVSPPVPPVPPRRRAGVLTAFLVLLPIISGLYFLFGYSSFYSMWCSITGTGYNPAGATPNAAAASAAASSDTSLPIDVYFTGMVLDQLPLRFGPSTHVQRVRIGEDATVTYQVQNLSATPVRFRPVHSVAPLQAAPHFLMKVCFCFNDQTLDPGESRTFEVRYAFAAAMDRRISAVTVGYSLFRLSDGDGAMPTEEQLRIRAMVEGMGGVKTPGFNGPPPAARIATAAEPATASAGAVR